MSWLVFALGFITFPLLAIAALVLIALWAHRVDSCTAKTSEEIQQILRALLDIGKNNALVQIRCTSRKFGVRIYKRLRKRMKDTLWMELRSTECNEQDFRTAIAALDRAEVAYDIVRTPRLRKLSRIQLKAEPGGPLAVSALSHIMDTIYDAIGFGYEEGVEVHSADLFREPKYALSGARKTEEE